MVVPERGSSPENMEARTVARHGRLPIQSGERTRGESKMSLRIVIEALWLITRWDCVVVRPTYNDSRRNV